MRIRRLSVLATAAVCVSLALPAADSVAEPTSIQRQRAEVAQLEARLAEMDAQVGEAAEAYNGARYEQDQIRQRIAANTRRTTDTQKRLKQSQEVLAGRLRSLYANPDPTLVEVIAASGSVTSIMDGADMLDRVSRRDGMVVKGIRNDLADLKRTRVQLDKDKVAVEAKVAEAEQQKARVTALLQQRQATLNSARGELRQMVAAEQARQRRIAEERARRVEAARQAQQRAEREAAARARATSRPSSGSSSPSSPSASPSSPQATPTPSSSGNAAVVGIAMRYLGVPYRWGGASPSGFDCSGLASYVYAQIGKDVPHYTGAIWAKFPRVTGDLQPGDLVFFHQSLSHMGIYIGNGNFIHAPSTGDVVKIQPLSDRASNYVGAVRP